MMDLLGTPFLQKIKSSQSDRIQHTWDKEKCPWSPSWLFIHNLEWIFFDLSRTSTEDIFKIIILFFLELQVFSLSLEGNLKPKYMYLVNELQNEVHSLTKYPTYLSLSLDQRIRPRHRFLISLKKAPKGPFPLSSFVPTDECFCQQWAGTTLDTYLNFRQRLLLKEFAKKYEKRWLDQTHSLCLPYAERDLFNPALKNFSSHTW